MMHVNKPKLLPPHLVIISMLLMYVLDRYAPIFEWRNTQVIAYVLMTVAFLCIVYCVYVFYKNNTEIKPLEESSCLIVSWPYTISRNPIYLCMVIFLAGWGLWLQSISSFLIIIVFAVWIHKRFVIQEEQLLENTFGASYRTYKQRVRCWV